jgi:hypothetical protein
MKRARTSGEPDNIRTAQRYTINLRLAMCECAVPFRETMHPEDQNPVLSDHKNAAFNAFLMMRFADRPVNREIRQGLEKALARYAIQLLRADQKAYSASRRFERRTPCRASGQAPLWPRTPSLPPHRGGC